MDREGGSSKGSIEPEAGVVDVGESGSVRSMYAKRSIGSGLVSSVGDSRGSGRGEDKLECVASSGQEQVQLVERRARVFTCLLDGELSFCDEEGVGTQ